MSAEVGGIIVGIGGAAIALAGAAFAAAAVAGIRLAIGSVQAASLAARGLYRLSGELGESLEQARAAARERRLAELAAAQEQKPVGQQVPKRQATAATAAADDEAPAEVASQDEPEAASQHLAELEAQLEALESHEQTRMMLRREISRARRVARAEHDAAALEAAAAELAERTEAALARAAETDAQIVDAVARASLTEMGFGRLETTASGERAVVVGFRDARIATIAFDGRSISVDLSRSGFERQTDCDRTLERLLEALERNGLSIAVGKTRPRGGGIVSILADAAAEVTGATTTVEECDDETVIYAVEQEHAG